MTRNRLTIALWAAILLVAGLAITSGLKVDDDLTVFLPSEGAPVQDLLFTRLREGPAARLILVAFGGGTSTGRVDASRAAIKRLSTFEDLARVTNGEQPMSPESFGALFDYRYLLADAGPLDRDALEQAVAKRERQLQSPFAKLYEKEASLDLTGLFQSLLLSWQDGTKPPAREGNVWVSPDGSRSLVLIETSGPGYTLDRQVDTVVGLKAVLDEIATEHGVEALMAGTPVSTVKARDKVRQEMMIGSAIAVLLIAGFLFWIYRSLWFLALAALPIASGILIGLFATLTVFGSIHRITLAFGITLLGVAIDYPLHLFSHTHRDERLSATATRILPPMLMGAITTIAAFLVLGTGGFTGLAQLAVFIGAGLAAAVATALWILPGVIGDHRLFRGAKPIRDKGWTPPSWLPPLFMALSVLALLLLVTRGDRLWERDLSAISPVPSSVKVLDGALRADLGAPDLRYLFLVSGDDAEAMLQASEALESSLATLVEKGAIGGFDAVHRYIPSEKTQLERRTALPDRATLEGDLAAALASSDLDQAMFGPFIDAVDASRSLQPLSPEDVLSVFEGTPLWPKLVSLMVERNGRQFGFIPLSAVQSLDELRATAAAVEGADFLDLKEVSANSIDSFRNQALIRLLAGLAVILVLLLLVRRDVMVALRILAAMVSALLVTASVLVLFGEKFSLFHILASLVVIGVGLDYGLFFSWKVDVADDRRRAFHGILICAVSTTIVFALLAASSISVLRVIGTTVALGTCLTFLSCYLLVALPTQKALSDRSSP